MANKLFQKVIDGELSMPKAAATLGAEILKVEIEEGTISLSFEAFDSFTNPVGDVQGGFLAAMLDDTMGPALTATLNENEFAPTIEMKINFVRPAKVGRLTGFGRVVSKGSTICFLEGELYQNNGLIAKSTATAIIRSIS